MGKNKVHKGEVAFEKFYQGLYQERWPTLKEALLSESRHVLLRNPYSDFSCQAEQWMPHAFMLDEVMPAPGEGPQAPYYFMDAASYFAPFYLSPQEGDRILDLCAAPGGKSLVLSFLMKGKTYHLTSNDKSTDRRFRMQRVLRSYIPNDVLEKSSRITGFDASGWCLYEQEAYDRILLDAPCSSERHVLESAKHLQEWSLKRTKRLAALQWKMLASSWLVLKSGGTLVYSTCSISPLENDDVVAKLIKKYDNVTIEKPELPMGEETSYGHLILPDQTGFGPFYLCVLKKG